MLRLSDFAVPCKRIRSILEVNEEDVSSGGGDLDDGDSGLGGDSPPPSPGIEWSQKKSTGKSQLRFMLVFIVLIGLWITFCLRTTARGL
jgi:hypothetical protein